MHWFILMTLFPLPLFAGGHGEFLDCKGQALSLEIERGADFCTVDGRKVFLASTDPFVCHISNPQLRILTIAEDLSFVYEDTDDDRIRKGTCRKR
ncbi:MAG: hypothetical protein AAFV87_06210 [Pseudomonadota bacterium]